MTSTDLVPMSPREVSNSNLRPFQPGPDSRRRPGRGKASPLDDPEWFEIFCKAVAEGLTSKELAELFSMHERTMRMYKKQPKVKAAVMKMLEDRVIRITRKVDSEIENRLRDTSNMDTETLLKVRKEFLGGIMRKQAEGGAGDMDTIHEAMEAIESNPDFAEQFQALLDGQLKDTAVA